MATQLVGPIMPIKQVQKKSESMAVTKDMKKFQAYATLRQARVDKKQHGYRLKKAKEAEADK